MELFKLFGRIMVNNDGANKNLEETEKKAKEAADAIEEIVVQAKEMAVAVASAVASYATDIGTKAVSAADDLQKSLNKLQAQTGASNTDMNKFKDSIMTLYRANVGQSFDDIAASMSEVARTTGLTGKDLELTTKNAMALRDTFDMGVNETARTANSLMKQFGISSEQAYTLIAQGAQQGANKNGDLLDTLNEYSVQFKTLGFSANEFTGVLIDGAKNGAFSIDKVGDAVKEFTIRSKDGSKASTEAFQGLGLNAQKMSSAFAKGGESAQTAFSQVMTKLQAIEDPVKKNAIGVGLFGTQFEDLEAGAIEALGNIQSKTNMNADTLDKINNVKYDSFGEALAGVGRQLNADFFIPLGEKLIPKLEQFMDLIKKNEPAIKEALGKAVDVVAGIFNAFAKAIQFVIDNFDILLPIIIGITAAIVAQNIISFITGLYQKWTTVTKGLTAAQIVFNAVSKASPFGLIALAIGAIVAIGFLLVKNWASVKSFLITVWGGIKTAAIAVWIGIKIAIISVWNSLKNTATSVWNGIKTFFKTVTNGIRTVVLSVWNGIKTSISAIWNSLIAIGRTVFNGLKSFLISVWNGIKSSASAVWNGIKTVILAVFTPIKSGVRTAMNTVKSIFSNIVGGIKKVIQGMSDFMKKIFDGLIAIVKAPVNVIIGILNGFVSAFQTGINLVIRAINSIPDIKVPDILGGWTFGLPDIKEVKFAKIPALAEGGTIKRQGTVLVGERGPEFLNLPRGASVVPLDKTGVVVNINNPHIFNDRDAEKFGDLLVRYLKMKGIAPRGV